MSYFTHNIRFYKQISIAIIALLICLPANIFAYEEKQVRRISKRVWSIINGKVTLDKSVYAVQRIRISTPTLEQLKPQTPKNSERIPAMKLQELVISSTDYKEMQFGKKKIRSTYSSSTKGSSKSFLQNSSDVSKFCNTSRATAFCVRETETKSTYFGNSPSNKPRKEKLHYKYIFYKIQESNEFVEKLIEQSNR